MQIKWHSALSSTAHLKAWKKEWIEGPIAGGIEASYKLKVRNHKYLLGETGLLDPEIIPWHKFDNKGDYDCIYRAHVSGLPNMVLAWLRIANQYMTDRISWYWLKAPVMHYYEHSFMLEPRTELPAMPPDVLMNFANDVCTAILLRDEETLAVYAQSQAEQQFSISSIAQMRQDPPRYIYDRRQVRCLHPLLVALCRHDEAAIGEALTLAIRFAQNEAQRGPVHAHGWDEDDFQLDHATPYSPGLPPLHHHHLLARYIHLPWLLVLECVFADDAEGFNQTLQQALRSHYYHYSEALDADGEDQIYIAEGWVSLLLSAACVLAEQRGLVRSVTSDYMPEWLIAGDFDTGAPPHLADLMYTQPDRVG